MSPVSGGYLGASQMINQKEGISHARNYKIL